MNPHTGQTTHIDLQRLYEQPLEERARAAREVGLDDPDDLVLIQGNEEHVNRVSRAVADARARERRRTRRKQQRASRKRNRR